MQKIILLISFLSILSGLSAQSISLAPITELTCTETKGQLTLNISNRGAQPLLILATQSSHSAITIKVPDKAIKPSSTAYLRIEYDLSHLQKEQVAVIVLQTNDFNQPKTTLLLALKH